MDGFARPLWAGAMFSISFGIVVGLLLYIRVSLAYTGDVAVQDAFSQRIEQANR